MTPAARVAAAITVLDDILAGASAEQALKAWGRASRFAGSKDRAALRDLVFDALRCRASCAALGGGLHGRGLMLGLGVQQGWALGQVFSGDGYGPAALTETEETLIATPPELTQAERLDAPAWIVAQLETEMGAEADKALSVLRERAGLFLRVNQRRGTAQAAIAALASEKITAEQHPQVPGCLIVTQNPRRVAQSAAYSGGLVEVQDAASQIAVQTLQIPEGARVLDYCAGGGGKALALADQYNCAVTAHDIAVKRMGDIAPRAQRAGVQVAVVRPDALSPDHQFDVVVVDTPCSGSGTWRRNPDAKWALTPDDLARFSALQGDVLAKAAQHLKPGGTLAYMTCSIFAAENSAVVEAFARHHPTLVPEPPLQLIPSAQWDGFFCQILRPRGNSPLT